MLLRMMLASIEKHKISLNKRKQKLCSWIRSVSKDVNSRGFPGGAVVENLPANAGDTGSSPGLGRSHMLWSN